MDTPYQALKFSCGTLIELREQEVLFEKAILTVLIDICALETQAVVAAKLGVSRQYLCDVLKGRRGISQDLPVKLQEAF